MTMFDQLQVESEYEHEQIDEFYNKQDNVSDEEYGYETQQEDAGSYESLNGQDFQDTSYKLSRENEVVDRLHFQHYLFKSVWQRNFSAPIEHKLNENACVLDVW